MDTYLISPSSNYWVDEFAYNPDEINQFSMSRIIGLGLSLIKNLDSQNYLQNANFLVDKFLSKNVHKKLNTENVKDKEKPKIKEKKVESKNENKESKSGLKNKKNFKIDTSFLDND